MFFSIKITIKSDNCYDFSIFTYLLLFNTYSESIEIPDWIKDNAEKLTIRNNFNVDRVISLLENLSEWE